jgi:hypothetical protein
MKKSNKKKHHKHVRVVKVTPHIEQDVHEVTLHVHSEEPPPALPLLPAELETEPVGQWPPSGYDVPVGDAPASQAKKHGFWAWLFGD